MRSLLLVALLLVGACNPVLSPDVPNSLTGTWTVQMSFSGVRQVCRLFEGCWEFSLACTGQTTWTVEHDYRMDGPDFGITGIQTGILSCKGEKTGASEKGEKTGASEMDMNYRLWGGWKENTLSIHFNATFGCIQFNGTMRTATTADGTVGGAPCNWAVGTWSATRK